MTTRTATRPPVFVEALEELHGVFIATPIEEGALIAPTDGMIVYENSVMLYIIQPLYTDKDRDHLRRQMCRVADTKKGQL